MRLALTLMATTFFSALALDIAVPAMVLSGVVAIDRAVWTLARSMTLRGWRAA